MKQIIENIKKNRNKIIFSILAIVILIGFNIINDRQKLLHSFLIELANDFNKDLPLIVNSETRFDYTKALSRNKFGYYYTLLLETYDEINVEEFTDYIKPNLLIHAKDNAYHLNFIPLKVTQVYIFNDKNGIEIISYEIKPKELK